MNRVLEAIATERSELTARLQALEEMERLCRVFDGDSPAEVGRLVTPRISEPPRPEVREPIRALPPVRRTQPQPPRRKMASPSEMQQRAELVLTAVREMEPCKSTEIRERTGLPSHVIKEMLIKLRDEGLVRHTGPKNRHGLWHLTATLDRQAAERHGKDAPRLSPKCRDDILATIRSDPNQWTEQRIADTGAWDREQVADACGYLLDDGLIVLNGDGTYRPAMLGLEAAA